MVTTHEIPDKARPSWLTRQLLKFPVCLYRLGLGARLRKRFLALTTTGRRTGRPRTVGLDYVEEKGRIYVFVGYGPRSDWYRNLLAQPQVTVQVGQQRLRGLARPVENAAERCRLLEMLREQARVGAHGPPRPARWFMKHLGILDYDAELERAVAKSADVPVVEITPLEEGKGP